MIIHELQQLIQAAIQAVFEVAVPTEDLTIQETNKDFEGDFTLMVFPLIKKYRWGAPPMVANKIGEYLKEHHTIIKSYAVVQGFLNLVIDNNYWKRFLVDNQHNDNFFFNTHGKGQKIMIEFCSPNTNKPLHLGHLRNLMLGDSVTRLFAANGYEVIPTCLYNDRGIAICKSMYAWQQQFSDKQPADYQGKGDKLVGDCYVAFSKMIEAEVAELVAQGMSEDDAKKNAPSQQAIEAMLIKWEEGDAEVRALWKQMNEWVYEANNKTFKRLGITFDKFYYESDLYELGRDIVVNGYEDGIFSKNEKGAIGIDLSNEGLDFKVLVRSNGTTVYMTQDIGMADQKYQDFGMERSVYVVGNEQDYHFQVLFKIMKKLGRSYADGLYHLSYGMVDLPTGKMKSREGTTVEAEDLIDEVVEKAKETTLKLASEKSFEFDAAELQKVSYQLGMGALKYYLLKVDPVQRMLFDPQESVALTGHTGIAMQYSATRTISLARVKADFELPEFVFESKIEEVMHPHEKQVVKTLYKYPEVLKEAAESYNPAIMANYLYDLSRDFNRFYHDCKVLNPEKPHLSAARFAISTMVGKALKNGLATLGIETPERM